MSPPDTQPPAGPSAAPTALLHHCKFIDHRPSSVTAIAFPPLPLRSSGPSLPAEGEAEMGLMACAKANGDIDLYHWVDRAQGGQGYVLRNVLRSPKGTKVETLVFTLKQSFLRPSSASSTSSRSRNVATLDDVRLFSSGGSSDLVEWDLHGGCILRLLPTQSGSLWSLAANPSSTLLALGCEDGSLRLVSLLDDEDLTHERRFERTKTRLLSIAWGPPSPPKAKAAAAKKASSESEGSDDDDDDEDEVEAWEDHWLVTGCSDSCLRKWDFKTGRVVERMVVEKEKFKTKGPAKTAPARSVVWCVGVLRDGTIVSGDSMGNVKFWDVTTATQFATFKAHGADVLCLTISPDQRSVFTSGIDQKTVQFSLVALPSTSTSTSASSSKTVPTKWIQSATRRLHTHDVLTLSIYPPASPSPLASGPSWPRAPVLASSGVDTTVVLVPCSTPGAENDGLDNPLYLPGSREQKSGSTTLTEARYRKLGGMNGADAGLVSVGGRFVVLRRDRGVGIWRVEEASRAGGKGVGKKEIAGGWEKVLEMELKTTSNLLASAISQDGQWLAVSDLGETKLFRLDDNGSSITPHRIRDFSSSLLASASSTSLSLAANGTGASSLLFTPDSSKLILATIARGDVLVVDLAPIEEGSDPTILRVFEQAVAERGSSDRVVTGSKRVNGAATTTVEDDSMDVDGEPSSYASSSFSPAHGANRKSTVTVMAVSADGQYLAVADTLSRTRLYNLDTLQLHARLPTFPGPSPSSLSFVLPNINTATGLLLLLALPAGNALHVYSVEHKRFPPSLAFSPPPFIRELPDPVLGLAGGGGPTVGGVAVMWGATWVCRVKLGQPGANGGLSMSQIRRRKKRERENAEAAAAKGEAVPASPAPEAAASSELKDAERWKLSRDLGRPLIGMQFLSPTAAAIAAAATNSLSNKARLSGGELVLVERPWLDLVATLPASYFKPGKYGT